MIFRQRLSGPIFSFYEYVIFVTVTKIQRSPGVPGPCPSPVASRLDVDAVAALARGFRGEGRNRRRCGCQNCRFFWAGSIRSKVREKTDLHIPCISFFLFALVKLNQSFDPIFHVSIPHLGLGKGTLITALPALFFVPVVERFNQRAWSTPLPTHQCQFYHIQKRPTSVHPEQGGGRTAHPLTPSG